MMRSCPRVRSDPESKRYKVSFGEIFGWEHILVLTREWHAWRPPKVAKTIEFEGRSGNWRRELAQLGGVGGFPTPHFGPDVCLSLRLDSGLG